MSHCVSETAGANARESPCVSEPYRDRVHQAATAHPTRGDVAEDVAHELAFSRMNLRDGARRRAHADGNPRAFKCRAGGRGGAQEALPISHDEFAVCAQVDQRGQCIALVQPGCENSSQDVAADESSQARQKMNG